MLIYLKNLFLVLIILICGLSSTVNGQELYGTAKVGALYYQGDLTPLSNKYSTSQACFGFSTGLKYYTSDFFAVYTDFTFGSLKGDDMYAKDVSRQRRNLSFKTYLVEYGLGFKYSINHFAKFLDKAGISVELVLGGNYFWFNPQAYYKGKWIDLQPLATEGQGWRKGSDPKYDRLELSLSRGISIDYRLNKRVIFGIEAIHRKTFTDYIDDVSTTYVNYDELVANSSVLSAELANRTGELEQGPPIILETGSTNRGNSDKNDSYLYTALTFSYRLYY